VLLTPAAAFANDLAPITVPLPLQRTLLLLAAILLPLEVGLRRLRISPLDALDWLRHPHRLDVVLPWHRSGDQFQPAAWMPGAAAKKRAAARIARPYNPERPLSGHVTPGLARETAAEDGEDALGATLKWLAARRGNSRGDSG
jgi:hypothetical protein